MDDAGAISTSSSTAERALPPGRMGLPIAGETLAFLRNPFRFLEERQRRHGDVWKSRMLGRKIVFLAGTEGAQAFYDSENITRADAHPFPLVDLFGGINMEMYDGPRHQALKSMALRAFDHEAIAGYLPDMQSVLGDALERMAALGELSAVDELRPLAIEAICRNILGLPRGDRTAAMTRDYAVVLDGLVALPLAIPGTAYGRARAARDRLLRLIRQIVAERRAAPSGDGLSRILQARSADGRTYTDDEAVLEAHHMFIAGFIVYALMAEGMRRLAEDQALHDRCVAEVRAHCPTGPLTMAGLSKLRLCLQVVLETKRIVPLVPLAFGRARRDFACGGYRVPAGWTVYLALGRCNLDPTLWKDPDRFDPDRFGPERAEHRRHPLAFIPQGADPPTGHRCLGLDYSTFLTLGFLVLLLRDYHWELPPQDLGYVWTTIPPRPRDGLRVRLHRR